jgi:5-methylcytosine-specific restriction endonuclease McrA
MIEKPKFPKKPKYRGVPMSVRRAVWERCSGICEGPVVRVGNGYDIPYLAARTGVCGQAAVDLAHVNHRKLGGSREWDTEDNLVALCRECHFRFDNRIKGKSDA